MAENTDVPENADENLTDTDNVKSEAAVDETVVQAAQPAATEVAPQSPRWRDRVWSFRSMVAVAAATLLLGGAGGAALVAVTDGGHDRPDRMGRFAEGPGGRGGDGFQRRPQFNQNGPQQGQQQGQQQGLQEPPAAPGSTS